METLDSAQHVYRKLHYLPGRLDNEPLERCIPLDNGRHDCTPISTGFGFATSQLNRLPIELVIEILLQLDIPSLTRFRCINRRAMQLVNSIHQYAAIIEHCPNIIRAIITIQAEAFDCDTLYRTLCTTQCSTCNRFGDYLYLIVCRRVCYFCLIKRPEYPPLEINDAYRIWASNVGRQRDERIFCKFFSFAKPPKILSLPEPSMSMYSRGVRPRLFDLQVVIQGLLGSGPFREDYLDRDHQRFKAVITAPVLLNGGRQVDY